MRWPILYVFFTFLGLYLAGCQDGTVSGLVPLSSPYCSSARLTNAPYANSGEANVDGLSEANAYTLCTVTQYQALAATSTDWDKYVILKSNLDLSGETITSIGSAGTNFTGTFDGGNYTISNLTSATSGLFGVVGAAGAIQDLNLSSVSITAAGDTTGALAHTNNGTISGVGVSGTLTGANGKDYLGLLVGLNTGTVEGSYSSGTVAAGAIDVADEVSGTGGLVGLNSGGSISSSYSTADVSSGSTSTSAFVGGLAGTNGGGEIYNSYATGDVSAPNGISVGGLVGINVGTIIHVYATGDVTGSDGVGGLIGQHWDSSITHSYASGNVTATTGSAGGLIGMIGSWFDYGRIENSFFVGGVTGVTDAYYDIGTILTTGYFNNLHYDSTKAAADGVRTGATGHTSSWFYDTENAPMSRWNISDNWQENIGALPTLSSGPTYCTTTRTANAPYANSGEAGVDGLSTAGAYTLCTVTQYQALAATSTDWDKYIILKSNLHLSSEVITSIGSAGTNFTGTFDGEKNTIFYLNSTTSGLFGVVGAAGTIQDLNLISVIISSADSTTGALAHTNNGTISGVGVSGLLYGANGKDKLGLLVGFNSVIGTIEESYSSGTITAGAIDVADDVVNTGGLVGLNYGSISSSYSTADVSSGSTSSYAAVGGLVGYNNNGGSITKSYATGDVSALNGSMVGGLVGRNIDSEITKSYATGDVSAPNGSGVGGLMGVSIEWFVSGSVTMEDNYATGDVTGSDAVGGLIGNSFFHSFQRSYASGNVTATTGAAGGIIGQTNETADNCFFFGNVTGVTAAYFDIGGFGSGSNLHYDNTKTAADGVFEPTTAGHASAWFYDSTNAPMSGWNFTTIWQENPGALPSLR